MNRGGFSWKRFLGVSGAKARVSRRIGIPLTKSGRQRKVGRLVTGGGCLLYLLLSLALLLAWQVSAARRPAPPVGMHLVQSIPLPGVEGRIDHMAVDVPGGRLFVAALGNNTVEVVDLQQGKRVHRISDLHEPQGVIFAPDHQRLFVANGEGGSVGIYDGVAYGKLGAISLSGDADNVRYDAAAGHLYVGYGKGGLAVVDVADGTEVGAIRLGGHPESFQLEHGGNRIFVNVPAEGQVAVVNRDTDAVVATWPLEGVRANFPMALDETEHRVFIGCRDPSRLLVYDTEAGREVERLAVDGDPDDVFLDTARKKVYVSCGAGYLDVFKRVPPDSCSLAARVPTAPGARTCLYVPELDRLYLAVPHRGAQRAEIRVYACTD